MALDTPKRRKAIGGTPGAIDAVESGNQSSVTGGIGGPTQAGCNELFRGKTPTSEHRIGAELLIEAAVRRFQMTDPRLGRSRLKHLTKENEADLRALDRVIKLLDGELEGENATFVAMNRWGLVPVLDEAQVEAWPAEIKAAKAVLIEFLNASEKMAEDCSDLEKMTKGKTRDATSRPADVLIWDLLEVFAGAHGKSVGDVKVSKVPSGLGSKFYAFYVSVVTAMKNGPKPLEISTLAGRVNKLKREFAAHSKEKTE